MFQYPGLYGGELGTAGGDDHDAGDGYNNDHGNDERYYTIMSVSVWMPAIEFKPVH